MRARSFFWGRARSSPGESGPSRERNVERTSPLANALGDLPSRALAETDWQPAGTGLVDALGDLPSRALAETDWQPAGTALPVGGLATLAPAPGA